MISVVSGPAREEADEGPTYAQRLHCPAICLRSTGNWRVKIWPSSGAEFSPYDKSALISTPDNFFSYSYGPRKALCKSDLRAARGTTLKQHQLLRFRSDSRPVDRRDSGPCRRGPSHWPGSARTFNPVEESSIEESMPASEAWQSGLTRENAANTSLARAFSKACPPPGLGLCKTGHVERPTFSNRTQNLLKTKYILRFSGIDQRRDRTFVLVYALDS